MTGGFSAWRSLAPLMLVAAALTGCATSKELAKDAPAPASAAAEPAAAPVVQPAPGNPGEPFVGTAAQQLENARAQFRALELRLKPDHPDMRRARSVIA